MYGGNVQAPTPTPASYFNYAALGPPPTNTNPAGGWTNPQAWANYYQGTNGFTAPAGGNTPAAALGAETYASYSPQSPNLMGWEMTYGNPNTDLQQNQSWAQSLGNAPTDGNYNQANGGWTNPNAWAAYYSGTHGFQAPTGANSPAAALSAAAALSQSSPYDPNILGWEIDFGQPGNILASNPNWAASLGTPQTNAQGIGIPQDYNTGVGAWESPLAWAAYYGGIQGYGTPVNNTLQGAQAEAGITNPHDPSLLGWELDYGNPQTVVNTITASQVYKDYLASLAQYQQQQQQYQQQLAAQQAQVANEQAWYAAFANNPQGYFSSSFLSHILGEPTTDPQRAAYEALYGDPNWISAFTKSPANSQYYWPTYAPTVRSDLATGAQVPFTAAWESEYGPPSVWYNEGRPTNALPPTESAIWTYKGPGRTGVLNDVNTQNLEAAQLNASGTLPPNVVADFVALQGGKPALDYLVTFDGQSVFAPPDSTISFTTDSLGGTSVSPNGTLNLGNGINVGPDGNLTSVGGVNVSHFTQPDYGLQPVTTQPIVLPSGYVASPGTPIQTIQDEFAQQRQIQAAINSGAISGGLIPQTYTDAATSARALAAHNANASANVHPFAEVAPGTGSYPNTAFGQANMTPFGSSLDPGNYLNNVISALGADASPQMQAMAAGIIDSWSASQGAQGAQNFNPAQTPGLAADAAQGLGLEDLYSPAILGLGESFPDLSSLNLGDLSMWAAPPLPSANIAVPDYGGLSATDNIQPPGYVGDVAGPTAAPDWYNQPTIGDLAGGVAGWIGSHLPTIPSFSDWLPSLAGYPNVPDVQIQSSQTPTAPGVAITPHEQLVAPFEPSTTEVSPQAADISGAVGPESTFATMPAPEVPQSTFAPYQPLVAPDVTAPGQVTPPAEAAVAEAIPGLEEVPMPQSRPAAAIQWSQSPAGQAAMKTLGQISNWDDQTVGNLAQTFGINLGTLTGYGIDPGSKIDLTQPLQPQVQALIGGGITSGLAMAAANAGLAAKGLDWASLDYGLRLQNPNLYQGGPTTYPVDVPLQIPQVADVPYNNAMATPPAPYDLGAAYPLAPDLGPYSPSAFGGTYPQDQAGYSYLPGSFGEIDPYNFSSVPYPAGAYGGGAPIDLAQSLPPIQAGYGYPSGAFSGIEPPGFGPPGVYQEPSFGPGFGGGITEAPPAPSTPIQAGYSYVPGVFGEIDPYNFSSAPVPAGAYGGGGPADLAQWMPIQAGYDYASGAFSGESVPYSVGQGYGGGFAEQPTQTLGGMIQVLSGAPGVLYGLPEPAPPPDYTLSGIDQSNIVVPPDYTLPGMDQGSTIPGTNYAAPRDEEAVPAPEAPRLNPQFQFAGRRLAPSGQDPLALIIHHTEGGAPAGYIEGQPLTDAQIAAGRGQTVASINATNRQQGPQYVTDREGNIMPGGSGAYSILNETTDGRYGTGEPLLGEGQPLLGNINTVGIENIAAADDASSQAQIAAMVQWVQQNYPDTPVFAHPDVNPGHKQETEGVDIVNAINAARDYMMPQGVAQYGTQQQVPPDYTLVPQTTQPGFGTDIPPVPPGNIPGSGSYYFGRGQQAPPSTLTSPEAVQALNTVGGNLGVAPAALAMVAMEESGGSTTNVTGAYKGLFQQNLGGGLAPYSSAGILQQSAAQQIAGYQAWWNSYGITQQLQRVGLQDLSGFTVPQQAAIVQAIQFAPNHAGEIVLNVLSGNYNAPATTSRQAADLGNTSFGAMSGAYLPRYVGGLGAFSGPPVLGLH